MERAARRRAEEGPHASHGDLTPERRRIAIHWRLNPSMDGSKRSLRKAEQGPHASHGDLTP
jgi:hypothetical protein